MRLVHYKRSCILVVLVAAVAVRSLPLPLPLSMSAPVTLCLHPVPRPPQRYFSIAIEFSGINPALMSAAIQIEIADILLPSLLLLLLLHCLLPPLSPPFRCSMEETPWDGTPRTSQRKPIPHDGTVTVGIDSRDRRYSPVYVGFIYPMVCIRGPTDKRNFNRNICLK